MTAGNEGFDRLRRRTPHAAVDPVSGAPVDPQGRRALYSVAEQAPALGAVSVTCSRCEETAVVTPRALVGLALPSLHLPLPGRAYPSWMRCPSCRARTWVRLGLRL